MAKSSTPRRSLKSLFSKKEVSHDDSVEKSGDKNEGQKKRFQFLKFKSKPKTDPGPVKAVHGSQQLLSAAEPSNSAEDGGTWVDNIASDNKKLSLYGTSPRSKASILPSSSQAKALSYSELDLRKPKRIASFSFGFRRKKKNDNEENISKSTTVLDSPGLEVPKEVTRFPKIQPPLRLSQVKLDETDTKMTFSMSQPVLDTSDKFEIPSPPPVATNQSESYFTISKQSESNVDINIHPEAKEPLTNSSNLSAVREDLQKAPIATIPELQLDNLESLEENENIPVYDNSNPSEPTTLTEMTFAVNDQSEPILSDSQPLIVPDTSNDKVAVAESVSLSNGPCDNDILQQSHKITEISLTETNRDALSYHQPDAPDTADSTAQNVELSLASVDSKIDATIMESTPVPHADNSTLSADSASVHQEVSISRTEGSTPETATTVTATSTVRKEKSTQPVSQTAIYGELYDSLLPQSLTLEVVSSISNPPSQIRTETRHLSTRSEPILVKTLNEHHTETNVIYSRLSTSRELYSGKMSNATGGYTNNNVTLSESKVIPTTSRFMSNETSTAFQPQRNTDIYSRYLTSPLNSSYKPADSGNIPHSKLTRSLSEVKSDSVSLIQDNVSSVSVVQSPAPPASDDVMSQEADAQVTDSKRRAILVKELVTEEVSSDPVCPSLAPEKMSATEGLEIKIEKRESFSAHSGLTSGSDRALSPAYLSMGSDDGSATEIYYSAEEDNAEEYTVDERKESHVVDVVKEAGLREQIPQKEEIAESRIKNREEGEFRVVIVKTQSEEDIIGKEQEKVDLNSRLEVQQQVRGQRSEDKVPQIVTSRFLVGSDTKSQEKEVAATVLPQVKEDRKEETKEKLPATLDNTEKSKDVEVNKVDERKESCVADVVKEAGLREEIPQKEEIAESGIKKTEEGEFRVVIAKTQSEEGKLGKKEEKLDLNSRTEVQQQVRSQRSEDKVPQIITSRFLVGSDAWSQEKEVAATVSPQVKGGREEEKKKELPATPVQQVNTLMVCDFAPPSSKPHGQGEGSEGNWTAELETEDPPNGEKQLPSQKTQYLSHKDTVISEYMHAVSSHTRKEDTITPRLREAEEQVSLTAQADKIGEESKDSTGTSSVTTASAVTDTSAGVKVVTGTLTHSTELQSDATETEHNRAPQSSEWVDTITQSTDRTRTVQEQVAVELSTPNVDTQRPDTKAAESLSERHQHPAEAQPDLNQGSLTASRTPTAASEVLASESQPTEADKELVDEMNSGYSSLSTKLFLKTSSPPKEDESKNRFRKVSLVNETDTTEVSEDAVDVSKTSTTVTESNGTDNSSDFKWKNRFEGVSQYRPYKTEFSSFTDSLSYRVSDTDTSPSLSSSSSALPEATAYKHLSNAYSSPSSSPAPDEHTTLGNRLSDRTTVYLRYESEPAEAPKDEWRRSLVEQEEPAAPAAEREGQGERGAESERIKSHWDSHELPVSSLSSAQQTSHDVVDSFKKEDDDDSSHFTGVFTATLVELVSEPAAPPSTPPGTPEEDSPSQFDMDSLVDTLKSMGPSLRPRNIGPRAPAPVLISSLPPIVEDAPSPITADIPGLLSPTKKMEAINNPAESLKGLYTLPADLGLKKTSNRDTRSPLELMKQSQQDLPQPGTRGLNLPQRASATNSIVMRKSSDSSPEELKSPVLNGNGLLPSSTTGSRLDSSVIFGSHRSASIDQPLENGKAHRSLFRTSSLPETGPLKDRMSMGPKELGDQSTEPAGSRFDRFSFLLNSSPSASSLTGSEDSTRISRPPLLGMGSPPSSNSPTRLLSPTGSIDLQRPFTTTDSPLSVFGQTQGLGMGMGVGAGVLSPPILQRSFSNEGIVGVQQTPLFNSLHGVSPFQSQEVETERTLAVKYRAFPDAYLTKEKEHGKLNPRPGKMYIFDRPGMCGQRIEIRSDVIDATPWELQETISIRVVRGGWVMYEKPNFKGEKIALDEGDIELTYPFSPPEEQLQNGQEGERQNGEATDAQAETKPARRFIIGSLRRAVRDYSVPEISLFPEENAEGKKVIFRDTSEDARIFGFPVKANSIIINAGLWLVYAHPFFQGVPRVLEVGGYSNPAAWGVEQPYVGSLHPLKVGEPRVENTSEPKMVIYDKPYFSGKSRTITTNTRDFITRVDRQQTAFMYNVGSLKVLGGIWVGYEKEGFRGHQYLLEEGEYQDWRVWGGNDAELRSTRVIRADLMDPVMVMFEQPEEDQEGMSEENTFEVTEAIPDVELFGYKTSTRSIHVLSGAWIAYSHVDFSGNQYIFEKGFYNNCADWGSQDTRICSVQPILLAPGDNARSRTEIILYSEPDFQGDCHVFDRNQEATPEKLLTKSCRVSGGSWVVYENKQYSGNLYVLSEGDYPSLTSMGCLSDAVIRSVKVVPMKFSVPSISLFGLECLEGREITTDTEIPSMVEEGFNNHILSVRVNSGCWVICEHSNYRGRQFLLEQIEITNWPKFSSLQTIGSMFPVRQKRRYFRIKSKERGHFMSVQGGVEEMKSGRVVVAPEVEPMSDIWFYQDGFIKSKLAQNMSLQVMGNIEPGAKVVLWSETRQPIQTWAAQMSGLITSLTFPGCVLDVKGGKTYDKDHVVMMPENEERPSQQWEIELL
ncbi:uncharacterized protein crybg2 isoform X6 [Epinephelus moara]|uniref:uncharacterized protein crybg2 isoform X6 n=1 Tax=Epinephelus moara TaxID=300413 RepID=UPI00214EF284|nr:uncharacterized protein crybg2 isoform X6 [Epinephelus moara]